jgi:hypothetical protein
VEHHEWQRWAGGLPVRRYCSTDCSGDVRFDEGDPARAEGNLLHDADLDTDDWEDFDLADESTAMAVAAERSIDPTTLGERADLPPNGLLGILPNEADPMRAKPDQPLGRGSEQNYRRPAHRARSAARDRGVVTRRWSRDVTDIGVRPTWQRRSR